MMRFLAVASLLLVGVTTASADRGRSRRPQHRPPPVDLGALRVLTTACQNAFEGPTNEQACLATVSQSRARFDVQASITACENAFDGDANELACLAIAVHAWQEPSPAITACENAFEGDASELTCLRTVTSSWLTPAAVTACENGFDGDANEQACLDTLVGTRYEPFELVRYCEDAYDGDANELACLLQFR